MYNDVLSIPVAREVTVVGYADDMAVIVVTKDLTDIEFYSFEAITPIRNLLKDTGIAFAEDKIEAVLIIKQFKEITARFRMEKHIITSKSASLARG